MRRPQSDIVTGNLTVGRGDKIWRHVAVADCGKRDASGTQGSKSPFGELRSWVQPSLCGGAATRSLYGARPFAAACAFDQRHAGLARGHRNAPPERTDSGYDRLRPLAVRARISRVAARLGSISETSLYLTDSPNRLAAP